MKNKNFYLFYGDDKSILNKELDDLKNKLSLEFANDRGNYTAGKHEFIEKILKQAYLWKMSAPRK